MPEENLTANRAVELGVRAGIQAALGQDGFDERDTYDTFGWPDTDAFDEESYLALYLRNAYARTVVDKPAFTTWRDEPQVDATDSFESEVEELADEKRLWSYCERVDRTAGIGEHGALILGLDDVVEDPDNWEADARETNVSSIEDINRFKPITQAQIDDIDFGGPGDERWGRPEFYTIDWDDDVDTETDEQTVTSRVHWTRVIDVPSTRLLDDDTFARPRMEPVLNNLLDIEKTLGSAAEQSYRGADYGVHLNFDPDKVDPDSIDSSELRDEFQRWYHDLQPEIKTVGGELETIGGEMQDPTSIVEANLDAISAQTGIPKKELRGNESGQVTGAEEDKKSYFGMISERRTQYATPHIVRAVLDRLQNLNILPTVEYEIEWPDLEETSEQEQAKIESNRASVIQTAGPMVGLTGGNGLEYLETGELPEDGLQTEPAQGLDESNPGVMEQFNRQFLSDPPELPVDNPEDTDNRLRNLWAEVINRAGLNVGGLTANDFTPELHPRDSKGRFVERPYNVPDELTNLDTGDLLSELQEHDPEFERKVQDLNIGGEAISDLLGGGQDTPDPDRTLESVDVDLEEYDESQSESIRTALENLSERGLLENVDEFSGNARLDPGGSAGSYDPGRKTVWIDPRYTDQNTTAMRESGMWASGDLSDLVNHEVVHAEHYNQNDSGRVERLTFEELTESEAEVLEEHVSNYAAENALEAVAEIGTMKLRGDEIPEEVEQIYQKYDGPEL